MTEFRENVPPPNLFATDQGMVAKADAEWESIMVQITLAWVIILGYLISIGMSESRGLAEEAKSQRQQNEALKSLVTTFGSSELGQERAQRIQLQWDLQLSRLLLQWSQVREHRDFFLLVVKFADAELVTLSDDLLSLPTEPSFQKLNTEIDRIFLSGTEQVSAEEIGRLMEAVVKTAGYNIDAVTDLDAWEHLSPEDRALYDDPSMLTPENLRKLKLQVIADLDQERKDLVEIQYALVGKIAAARLDKLAALPLGTETEIDVNTPDLARVMLERILSDLRKEVRLLPETEIRLRGTTDATPTGDPQ